MSDFSLESGTVTFEPVSGKGLYYIYYLPYKYRKDGEMPVMVNLGMTICLRFMRRMIPGSLHYR